VIPHNIIWSSALSEFECTNSNKNKYIKDEVYKKSNEIYLCKSRRVIPHNIIWSSALSEFECTNSNEKQLYKNRDKLKERRNM